MKPDMKQPTAPRRFAAATGSVLSVSLLLAGCATRTVRYERSADGAEVVVTRTTAVLTRIAGENLSEEIQTENLITGTKAGTLRAEPDSETIRAIAEGATAAVLKAVIP